MYVSDYGFATTQDYWTKKLDYYFSAAYQRDWLYLGSNEWLLTPNNSNNLYAFYVRSDGGLGESGDVTDAYEVRPSFYLLSSVTYASGTGSLENPIRLKN